MCTGRVDPSILLYAFEKGAEGIMVVGCKDKECRYGPGPQQTKKMGERVRGLMGVLGLEPERFTAKSYASQDMRSFVKKIGKLQKSPLVA
jgi:coenzyme F420-reducing hydrogenase delta subunit